MSPERVAGKRGRLPAQSLGLSYLHEYLATPLPAPSYPFDVSGGVTDWGMDGNDRYGDCTFAGRDHYEKATAAAGALTETWPTAQEIIDAYLAYTGGQDSGAVISDLLLYWYKAGTILAFAPVDHTSKQACDAAAVAFHGLYVGVDLTDNADQLFSEGQPWSIGPGEQPDPSEGHCILKVGSDGLKTDTWVTWGALQPSTVEWTAACLCEAWVIVTPEDAAAASLDVAQLRADIDALGGTGGNPAPTPEPVPTPTPIPEPTPTPEPPPAPTLLAKIEAVLRQLEALLRQLESEAWQDFCTQGAVHRHPILAVSQAREFRREVRRVLGMQP